MKALRLHAESLGKSQRSANASSMFKNPRVTLENTPKPSAQGKEILLKVSFCGVCGSDFHLAEAGKDRKLLYPGLVELPVTLGHEFSATVAGYGPEVPARIRKIFPIDTPVCSEEMLWCGECEACRAGNVNHCENLEEIGFTRNGAHAEYLCVPYKYLWSLAPLAENFSLKESLKMGALVEPYSVAFRALFQGAQGNRWVPGGRVLILGAGPIGLACLDLASASGATEVCILETEEKRRKFALSFGALQALAPKDWEKLKGQFDWIIDAAGGTALTEKIARKRLNTAGSICLLARSNEHGELNSEFLITKNARVFGSQGHSGESAFPRVITLMAAKKIRPLAMIQAVLKTEEILERLQKQKKMPGKILHQL